MTNPNRDISEVLTADDFVLITEAGRVAGRESLAKFNLSPEEADITVCDKGHLSVTPKVRNGSFSGFTRAAGKWERTTAKPAQ